MLLGEEHLTISTGQTHWQETTTIQILTEKLNYLKPIQ